MLGARFRGASDRFGNQKRAGGMLLGCLVVLGGALEVFGGPLGSLGCLLGDPWGFLGRPWRPW